MPTVFFEPNARIHSTQWNLINHPPEGYTFTTRTATWDRAVAPLVGSDRLFFELQYKMLQPWMPITLLKSRLDGLLKRPPAGTDLTMAYNHVVFRDEPWVMTMADWPTGLVGGHPRNFPRWRHVVERRLRSPWFRGLFTWSELSKRMIEANLDTTGYADKIEVIMPAVPPAPPPLQRDPSRPPKVLMVASADAHHARNFIIKGGRHVIDTCAELARRHPGIEFTIRAVLAPEMRARCAAIPNLRVIDQWIPWEELEHEFMTADVFLYPSYETPFGGMQHAMSYGLPVVTIDAMANAEVVTEGVTGYVVPRCAAIPEFVMTRPLVPFTATRVDDERMAILAHGDPVVTRDLADRVSLLIENPALRRQMGEAAREETTTGRLSITRRNQQLGTFLNRALRGTSRNSA